MKNSVLVVALMSLIALTGCQTGSNNCDNSPDHSLPKKEYLAGGGFNINYTASQDGTALLVDKYTEKMIQTKTLKTGETLEISVDPNDFEKMGISPSDAIIELYFVPAGDEIADPNS